MKEKEMDWLVVTSETLEAFNVLKAKLVEPTVLVLQQPPKP